MDAPTNKEKYMVSAKQQHAVEQNNGENFIFHIFMHNCFQFVKESESSVWIIMFIHVMSVVGVFVYSFQGAK